MIFGMEQSTVYRELRCAKPVIEDANRSTLPPSPDLWNQWIRQRPLAKTKETNSLGINVLVGNRELTGNRWDAEKHSYSNAKTLLAFSF
jgi:hypothetical protein